MFEFQKEVILNSKFMEDGKTPRIEGKDGLFRVLRCADYKAEYMSNVVKTEGKQGTMATATIAAPSAAGVYQVVIGISLVGKYMADYAMPWSKFAKGIVAEFVAGADQAANAEAMAKAIKAALPEDYKIINVAVAGNDVKIEGTDYNQVIKKAELSKQVEVEGTSEVEYVVEGEPAITANVLPIGTGEWLIENLRFPTSANTGYYALNAEETPIKGAKYDQYSFGYKVPRRGLGGQGTVGQYMESVTTHTFYALQGETSDAVNNALINAGAKVMAYKEGHVTLGTDAVTSEAITTKPESVISAHETVAVETVAVEE